MELDFISSENQLVDLFIKTLGRMKFEELHQRLGISRVQKGIMIGRETEGIKH